MYNNKRFLELFIGYRLQLGLSVEKIAELINEEPYIIENMENEHNKPVTRVVIKFLNILNKDIKELMIDEGTISNNQIYRNIINNDLINMERDTLKLILSLLNINYELGDEK